MNHAFSVLIATEQHTVYAEQICKEMDSSAKARGTGIAKRSPDYVMQKMIEGKAVIAFSDSGEWAGFCYIETWGHGQYVANSGLIVAPLFRKSGLARMIKQKIFELSRLTYPHAKVFGLTTGLAVMKINSELGYEPVTYSELTDDNEFWKGCQSCVNYEILMSKERKNCFCTAMLYDPAEKEGGSGSSNSSSSDNSKKQEKKKFDFAGKSKLYERFMKWKQYMLLKKQLKKQKSKNHIEKILFI